MHEAAITQALLEQVLGYLPEGARLTDVFVTVGELEHLDSGVMETMWAALSADTRAAGATLHADRAPLLVRCGGCGREYRPDEAAILLCPFCEKILPDVLSGSGVVLRSIEVEEEETST